MQNPDPLLDYKGVMVYANCRKDMAYQLMYAANPIRLGKRCGLRTRRSAIDAVLEKSSGAQPICEHTRPYVRREENPT